MAALHSMCSAWQGTCGPGGAPIVVSRSALNGVLSYILDTELEYSKVGTLGDLWGWGSFSAPLGVLESIP